MTFHQFLDQFLAAIFSYVVALSVALLVVSTLAVYNWARVRGLSQQMKLLGAGGKQPQVTVNVPPANVVGSGRPLLNAPVWNQLDDVLPDGQQDPYATTDCGEESVAMAVAACGGPSLPAGVYRQLLGGATRQGTTKAVDLVYLLQLLKVVSHPRSCPFDVAWIEWQHSYVAHFLVLALGWWVTDGYPHWVLIREIDDQSVTFNDPWGGNLRRMSKGWASMKYNGEYVHIDQPVTELAPAPPT